MVYGLSGGRQPVVYQTPESCMSLQCEKGKPPPAFKRSIPVHFEMPTCVARARRARAMRLPHLGWDDGESLCNVSLEFLRVLAKKSVLGGQRLKVMGLLHQVAQASTSGFLASAQVL